MTSNQCRLRVAILGGGAAGYFAAIRCAELHPDVHAVILEATHRPLLKVIISGGGRCNVTHHCFDPAELIRAYPRGAQELRGPFSRFQPKDTVEWFTTRGIKLKTENDGRMFPVTDDSSTVAGCLQEAARKAGVEVRLGVRITDCRVREANDVRQFELTAKDGHTESFDRVLMATGGTHSGYKMAASLGHAIAPLAPSLFTFTIRDDRLDGLAGISVPKARVHLDIGDKHHFEQTGPLLITHWGLSGPAVLKLSAFAARELLRAEYQAKLIINWSADTNADSVAAQMAEHRREHPKKLVAGDPLARLPRRLWSQLVRHVGIEDSLTWANLSRESAQGLVMQMTHGEYAVVGKGEFKEEFVTCGGIKLNEVDFRTMESKIRPGLYFAGEILDIDGITGGYNFQNAWTTGWIAGGSMG